MDPSMRFRVNTPDVIQETLDGEAVIVNLLSGSYYSLDETGSTVLMLVESGARADEIVAGVSARYQGETRVIAQAVEGLLRELRDENLIIPRADGDPAGDSGAPVPAANGSSAPETRPVFQTPVFRKYTDMQQLLLMDPIHEVDASGWPNSRIDIPPKEDERP